ncbi:patatin-like phospholipase family protein [Aestuariivirga litoralis]|uniref:patatin-like phospholipase family protein n=1 Tax=Aestuariivirga litoralis TaxID=2650924 RepID=UPI0018C4B295|nr:patatin-like phospholipase family protein [Aestuariivirga litoralis]
MAKRAKPELSRRDAHLFVPGRKRILSLDGGGVRGVVSLAFLQRIEEMVDKIEGKPTRLCDWFDLIGGTSTGAIIAAALALGYRVADIRTFYDDLAPKIFKKSRWRLFGWNAKFDAAHLVSELARVIGKRRLDSEDLQTGLCIVMKRMDTGSAWMVMNNSRSEFWESPSDNAYRGNRELSLAEIVRASTAAPSFFDPQLIEIAAGDAPGLFIDGGLTPHNNPALMMLMAAILPPYGLNWELGPDKLLIVSVGTGTYRPTLPPNAAQSMTSIGIALRSLGAMIAEGQQLVLTLMTFLGDSPTAWTINSEIGDAGRFLSPVGDLFRFLRYDIKLEGSWLKDKLGKDVSKEVIGTLRQMDNPANMQTLTELAEAAAALQVKQADLGFGQKSKRQPAPSRKTPKKRAARR